MKYKKEFKDEHPETVGETDSHFDLSNYCDWLESKYDEIKSDSDRKCHLDTKIEEVYKIAIKLGLNDEHSLFKKELRNIAVAAIDHSNSKIGYLLHKESNKYT